MDKQKAEDGDDGQMFTAAPESSGLTHICVQIATLFVHTRIRITSQRDRGWWKAGIHSTIYFCRLQGPEHAPCRGTLTLFLLFPEGAP